MKNDSSMLPPSDCLGGPVVKNLRKINHVYLVSASQKSVRGTLIFMSFCSYGLRDASNTALWIGTNMRPVYTKSQAACWLLVLFDSTCARYSRYNCQASFSHYYDHCHH